MYGYWERMLGECFSPEQVIKEEGEKKISRVRHTATGRFFVVRRFPGSAEAYRALLPQKSKNLPEIFAVAEKDGHVLVIEEYVQGDSLARMLEDGLFTEKEARRIAMDICRALYTLHAAHVVHRDVKPENILLRGDHAVLLDFDAARTVKEVRKNDTVVLGTTGYAAPEQYGISQTDHRADIYALGVTMNLMLTGEHPSVRLAGGRLGRIVSRCTMVHPSKRYADVRRLMEVLS